MKKQEIFDKVLKHLRKQGKPAFDKKKNQCLYRGPGGTKCAIGCLITNAEMKANKIEENDLVSYFPTNFIRAKFGRSARMESFLSALQSAHDDPMFNISGPQPTLREWRQGMEVKMSDIAEMWELVYNEP